MALHVGQTVQYFEAEGADPRAAQIVSLDTEDGSCCCLAVWCHTKKTYVEVPNVPREGSAGDTDRDYFRYLPYS
jgi:hypothetical protein